MRVLTIPIKINGLYVNESRVAANAVANFKNIPFFDKNGVAQNVDNPFISENIISQPFDNDAKIEKGVHLHFDIPIGLKMPQKLNNTRDEAYPPLPNRWLIIKNNIKKWIIESDYLWSEEEEDTQKQTSITVLLPKEGVQGEIGSRCRHVGKYFDFDDYNNNSNRKYWKDYFGGQGITAIGYGEPTFVGAYQNCKSVFGFYDINGKNGDTYEIIGWYSNRADLDCIFDTFSDKNNEFSTHLYFKEAENFESNKENIIGLANQAEKASEDFKAKYEKYLFLYKEGIKDKNPTFESLKNLEIRYNQVKAFENSYEWKYAENNKTLQLPEQLLFISKIEIKETSATNSAHQIQNAEVAIGNTGREALNALLAQDLHLEDNTKSKAEIERNLELIHMDAIVDKKVDLNYKFEEERQQKSFSPIEGGNTWQFEIALRKDDNLTSDNKISQAFNNLLQELTVHPIHIAILDKVTQLNRLKSKYNRMERNIQSKQHQLFADWYKYMLAAHPPIHDADAYIRADDIIRFINRFILTDIFDDVQNLDIIENNERKTIHHFGINTNLNLEVLKEIMPKFQSLDGLDKSILGQMLNLFFRNNVEKDATFHAALADFSSIFKDKNAFILSLKNEIDTIIANISLYERVKTDKDFSVKTEFIQSLESFYEMVIIVNDWKTKLATFNDFSGLSSFLISIKTATATLAENNKKAIHSATLRLQNLQLTLTQIELKYDNLQGLNRFELIKLLKIIVKHTTNLYVRSQANTLIDDTNTILPEIIQFIKNQLFITISQEIESIIDLIQIDFNIDNFNNKIDALIIENTSNLTTYHYPQLMHHFTKIQEAAELFLAKIDKEELKSNFILFFDAILTFKLKLEDNSITNEDISTILEALKAVNNYLENLEFKPVNSDFQHQKSITQLLEDLEKSIKQTIENIYEEKETKDGKIRIKKYAILEKKALDIQLSLNAEPRYYQAKEPVLLLRADNLTSQLPKILEANDSSYEKVHLSSISDFGFSTITNFNTNDIFKNLGKLVLEKPFWNPSFLEWQVEYIPINDPSEIGKYDVEYISENFVLNDDSLNLQFESINKLNKTVEKTARLYNGSTILSPHAIDVVKKKTEEYKSEERIVSRGLNTLNDFSEIDDLLEDLTDEVPIPKARGTEQITTLEGLQNRSVKLLEAQSNTELALKESEKILVIQEKIKARKFNLLQGSINDVFDNISLTSRDTSTNSKAILSQSLGGFNQCLLMRKQTMQLEIDDPITLSDYTPLIQTIRDFIGEEIHAAPEPRHFFNPIRNGLIRIVKLRIVDTFGQFSDVDLVRTQNNEPSKVITPETLEPFVKGNKTALIKNGFDAYLPTRIVQPLRLNLRWISNNDNKEAAENFHNSPICGWIIPNFLNETFAIFNQKGELLGDIGIVKDANNIKKVRLLPKPGAHSFYDFEIMNQYLRNLVNDFLEKGAVYFLKFLKNINEITLYADPEGFERHTELAMLVGKPLAIVRGKISFQAMEMYAINQDWSVFENDVRHAFSKNYKRDTYDFERVKFPIKLGHAAQLNDGLFGFWEGDSKVFKPVIRTDESFDVNTLKKSIDEKSTLLTMLFDPRGKLNAYTGILPTKTITIPESMYAEALTKMKIYFSIGPILTPKNKLQMPIPRSTIFEWKWVYESDYNLIEISTKPTIKKATFELLWKQKFEYSSSEIWDILLNNNWLGKIPDDSTAAYVNFDDKSRLPLPPIQTLDADWIAFTDNLLKEHYQGIASTNTDVQFGQMELREGWLKLMNEL